MPGGNDRIENRAVQVARTFFQACTKLSEDDEDILPQEDAVDYKLSVFRLFTELFPEFSNKGKNGLMRLQFNKLGYEIYEKEQSRRVPAVRAKPGNPGYGFRRARWRDPINDPQDKRLCEATLLNLGVSMERIERIKKRVHDFLVEWDTVRRPSRPAGPGRPRVPKRAGSGPGLGPEGDTLPGNMAGIDIEASITQDMFSRSGLMTDPSLGPPGWGGGLQLRRAGAGRGLQQGDAVMGREEERRSVHSNDMDGHEPAGLRHPDQYALAMHGHYSSLGGMYSQDMYLYQGMQPHCGYSYTMTPGMGGAVDWGGQARGGGPGQTQGSAQDWRYGADSQGHTFRANQQLRELNKSLIAQREQLTFDIEELSLETDELAQLSEDVLTDAEHCDDTDTKSIVDAFRTVLHGLIGMGRGPEELRVPLPCREAYLRAMQIVRRLSAEYEQKVGMLEAAQGGELQSGHYDVNSRVSGEMAVRLDDEGMLAGNAMRSTGQTNGMFQQMSPPVHMGGMAMRVGAVDAAMRHGEGFMMMGAGDGYAAYHQQAVGFQHQAGWGGGFSEGVGAGRSGLGQPAAGLAYTQCHDLARSQLYAQHDGYGGAEYGHQQQQQHMLMSSFAGHAHDRGLDDVHEQPVKRLKPNAHD